MAPSNTLVTPDTTITVYHCSWTGKGNAIFKSILKEGLLVPGGTVDDPDNEYIGQSNGLFAHTNETAAKRSAVRSEDEEEDLEEEISRPGGKPMVVVASCRLRDLELDYEQPSKLIKDIFRHFSSTLAAMPDTEGLKLVNGDTIVCLEPDEQGLNVNLRDPDGTTRKVFVSWENESFMQGFNLVSLLQELRNYLVTTRGEEYLQYEAERIMDAITHPHDGISNLWVKCHGPLEIESIETLSRGKWTISYHGMQGTSHTPDPVAAPGESAQRQLVEPVERAAPVVPELPAEQQPNSGKATQERPHRSR